MSDIFSVLQVLFSVTWYVYVGEKLDNADYTVRYIGRYAKRPSISEAKISEYDGENITFEYKDKLLKENARICLKALEFIGRLVRHIPNKNFRMIRYYGFYSNRTKEKCEELRDKLPPQYCGEFRFKETKTWRDRIIESGKDDPLACPNCGEIMKLSVIAYRVRDGPRLQTRLRIIPIRN